LQATAALIAFLTHGSNDRTLEWPNGSFNVERKATLDHEKTVKEIDVQTSARSEFSTALDGVTIHTISQKQHKLHLRSIRKLCSVV
jgi:hypothetical protein